VAVDSDKRTEATIGDTGIAEALPAIIWTTLAGGRCDFANRSWREYTGMSAANALDEGWQAAIHPDDRPALLALWDETPVTEREARLRRFDGEYRWFTIRLSPLPADTVERWCWLALNADETPADIDHPVLDGRLRRLLDMLPTQLAFLSPSLDLEFVNRALLDYYGRSLDDLRPWHDSGAIHPDDMPQVMARLSRLLSQGEPYDGPSRMRGADGGYRWMHMRTVPSRDAQGNIVRYCSIQTDVDDLKRAENLLAGEVAILEMVARGRPLPEVLNALSRLVEEIATGCLCSILVVAPDRGRFWVGAGPSLPDAYNQILDGKIIDGGYGPCSLSVLRRIPIITADLANDPRWEGSTWPPLMKSYGYASCWSMPIMSASGEASGIFAIYRREPVAPTPAEQALVDRFTKIAEIAINRAQADDSLKSRERELSRAHAQLAEGQRLSQTASFTSDIRLDQHSWSDEFYRILEIDPATAPALQTIRERVHPDDIDLFEQEIRRNLEGEDGEFTFRIMTPLAGLKHLRGVSQVIEHVAGRPVFMGTIQDVTASKVAEDALNRARSELSHMARVTTLGALTASIAHEVNQPLSGIITNASTCLRMLAADPPNIEGALATARRTIRDGNRASEVIKRLRALFTRKQPRFEPVDLNDAALEVLALSSSELRDGGVLVATGLARGLPMIAGDRVQIQQVILNLVLNALDAMRGNRDRPRNLSLSTTPAEPGGVTLSVHDSGLGFDAQEAEKMFEAFYSTKPEGMGVGLSISRSIIESHGGRLWATVNAEGGATFSFSLPATPADT
jgi:PAS domain S-box-containing protein